MDQYPNISPEELELIERYLTGQLDTAAAEAFRQDLASNDILRKQVEEVKLLITGIREKNLQDSLQGFHSEVATANVKPLPGIGAMKRWLVAASVIVLIGIAAWFAVFSKSGHDETFAAYYEKDPGLLSAMSSAADNYDFDRAMIDYKSGNNEAAIKSWELQLKNAPANDTLNYFLGSAYLASGNTVKAHEFFNKVISQGGSVFLSEAYWYAGLAYVREGKNKEAIPLILKSDRKEKESLVQSLDKK